MGRGMTKNLIEKGGLSKPVLVYNRTRARSDKHVDALGSEKVKALDTVAEVVSASDIIFSCLGTMGSYSSQRQLLILSGITDYLMSKGDDAAIKEAIDAALSVEVAGKLFIECRQVLSLNASISGILPLKFGCFH